MDLAKIIEQRLPEIIVHIAQTRGIAQYLNPSFCDPRLKKWHQYGLLEHSQRVRLAYLQEANTLLEYWGFSSKVCQYLANGVWGISKRELFEASIPLHDLGKILCLNKIGEDRNHEIESVNLLDDDFIKSIFLKNNVHPQQRAYIRECISLHEIIAKEIRRELRHQRKFELEYINSPEVMQQCQKIAERIHLRVEAGLFFLCDTLGKTEIRSVNQFKLLFSQSKVSLELEKAVRQMPVSLELARVYFSVIL